MLMKFLVLSTIVTIVRTHNVQKMASDCLKINDTWYEKEVILSEVGRPYHLAVMKSTNTLFFSYSLSDVYADIDFQLAFLNLDTKEHETIAGIRGGCSVAIDQGDDEIYLGGSDGIYKYNILTKLADFHKEKGKNIWSLFFKDSLFYISYPDQKLFIEVDGKFVPVSEFENFEVDNFHMMGNRDIYFGNKTGFYKFDGTSAVVDVLSEVLIVRQIVEDNDGTIYLCTNFGIYTSVDGELIKIVNRRNVFGLAFDRDNNLIFSDEESIVKLKLANWTLCKPKE